ncbi:unnamed protein product [Phytophthora lilii]|uniref:Unnamed protein product n=1 Tax=Phytophthora lilii TaxID=2077276 RepID=A0A9W6UB84_9STRA|nr:unnamed protein product [Phytophthora lilii]
MEYHAGCIYSTATYFFVGLGCALSTNPSTYGISANDDLPIPAENPVGDDKAPHSLVRAAVTNSDKNSEQHEDEHKQEDEEEERGINFSTFKKFIPGTTAFKKALGARNAAAQAKRAKAAAEKLKVENVFKLPGPRQDQRSRSSKSGMKRRKRMLMLLREWTKLDIPKSMLRASQASTSGGLILLSKALST